MNKISNQNTKNFRIFKLENDDMNGYELKIWRRGFGWCQEIAAEQLNMTTRTYQNYEKSESVPHIVILATQALSLKMRYNEMQNKPKKEILRILKITLEK